MLEVREGVWFVEAENGGRYPFSHSLFLEGEECLLVDTGAGAALESLASRVKTVVLSHYHRDHVSRNQVFAGSSFAIHRADAPGVESLEGFLSLSGLDRADMESYWKLVRQSGFKPTAIDRYLEDGDTFDLGRLKVRVLHFPGHTPGHCGYLVENYNLVYASDIDLTGFGPWYGNPTSDPDQFRASIRRLREMKPDLLLTAHTPPLYENIDRQLGEYEGVLDRRDEDILETLRKGPSTLDSLAEKNIIYRRHHGQQALLYFEKSMLQKHLSSLARRGLAAESDSGLYEAL